MGQTVKEAPCTPKPQPGPAGKGPGKGLWPDPAAPGGRHAPAGGTPAPSLTNHCRPRAEPPTTPPTAPKPKLKTATRVAPPPETTRRRPGRQGNGNPSRNLSLQRARRGTCQTAGGTSLPESRAAGPLRSGRAANTPTENPSSQGSDLLLTSLCDDPTRPVPRLRPPQFTPQARAPGAAHAASSAPKAGASQSCCSAEDRGDRHPLSPASSSTFRGSQRPPLASLPFTTQFPTAAQEPTSSRPSRLP